MMRIYIILNITFILQACATVSMVRPAHHLDKGQWEASAGIAANPANALFAAKVDYGISEKFELGLQFETLSFIAGGRYQIFSNPAGFALSVGFQTGLVTSVDDDIDENIWMLVPGLTFGWQKNTWNIYTGYKAMLGHGTYQIGSNKIGVRKQLSSKWFIGLEGGVNHYNVLNAGFTALGEGTLFCGLNF